MGAANRAAPKQTHPGNRRSSFKICRRRESVAANYVHNVAKPDGLTMVMPANRLYINQIVGRPEVKYDVRKFAWIGNPQRYYTVIYMRADAPYKSIADIISAKDQPNAVRLGQTAPATLFRNSSKKL